MQCDLVPGGCSFGEQGQIFLVVVGGHHKKGAVHPGGIQRRQHLRGVVLLGPSSKVRQTHLSGREGAASVPASDVATAGAAGEKGEKSGAAVSSFSLQPTGARAGTSHPPQTLPTQPPAARPIARCARRRAAQIASYTNPSFALGAVPQAHFPRTNDLCNCPQGCFFCARCAAIIDMKHKKTYEKQRNHLTNGRKYVTISKQSAPTVFYLKNRRTV